MTVVFLIATMVLAPGLLVNVLLKDHWGRSRPIDVTAVRRQRTVRRLVGSARQLCVELFICSGDVAGAFWTSRQPHWRRRIGVPSHMAQRSRSGRRWRLIRVMAGAHFPSDVIFAGVFTFIIIWTIYALIYRWPPHALLG